MTSVDCSRTALLRELPSPWRKDPLPVEVLAVIGPVGTTVAYADGVLTAYLPTARWGVARWNKSPWTTADPAAPVVIPVGQMTFTEFAAACSAKGVAVVIDPSSEEEVPPSGPLLASMLLPEATRTVTAEPVTFSRWSSDTWRLLDPAAERLAFEQDNVDVGLAQLNLLTSATGFADWWGVHCGILRHTGESDEDYTARVRWELLRPRENNQALADLLEDDFPPLQVSVIDDVVRHCFMPSDDLPLRARPLRGWYYNVATAGIFVAGAFPSLDMIAAAERHAACGVTIFVRGSYAFTSMTSPAGYDLAGSTLRFGVPIPMKINAPPAVGVGKIGGP